MTNEPTGNEIPSATIRTSEQVVAQRWRTRLWWLTGLCVLVALAVTLSSLRQTGLKILVRFKEGHGLKAGDTLRYRGIEVGSVTEVRLDEDMSGVQVQIELTPEHTDIAKADSVFWIERPRLRLGQVSGLETVIGAKYVGVLPGPKAGSRQQEFVGLEHPMLNASQDSTEVRVKFPAGEGLTAGDPVRYLGIDVGEVTYVELTDDLHAVWVGVRLVGAAQRMARVGTQFWVERPRLDISEVRGLDTLVAGRYLALEPPLGDSAISQEFDGLSEPPPMMRREGSLELELEARQRMGLVRGAPITYRGLEVGRVADVGLATDGASVTIRAIIEPEYVDLVRTNSAWWFTGGIKLDASLTGGVSVSIDSFASWLRGGLSFATPNAPGEKVATGHRFGVAEQADPTWLTWQPRIATGLWNSAAEGNMVLPRVVRIAATWQTSFLGFKRRQSLQSWCLPLDDGTALVSAGFLKSAADAKTSVNVEIAGATQELDPSQHESNKAVIQLPLPPDLRLESWPRAKQAARPWNGRTPLLIVNAEMNEPLPLDASRAAPTSGNLIEINSAVPLHKSLEGSAVIDTASGELLGLLVSLNNRWVVAR